MRFRKPCLSLSAKVALFSTLCLLGLQSQAKADVVRSDFPTLLEGLPHTRIYEWRDPDIKPRGVAIAMHGLILHGGVYDVMARDLAGKGFIVVAPDMRGYGRWCSPALTELETVEPETGSRPKVVVELPRNVVPKKEERMAKVEYDRSYHDLSEVLRVVRNTYPSLPLFIIGESLGAGMALHAAADSPGSIDGLVLSSPAIKHRLYMEPRMVVDAAVCVTNPNKQLDLVPYMKHLASNDQKIVEAMLNDPLVRKRLTVWDLLKTSKLVRSNIRFAEKVPRTIPVLIIQGDQDRIMKWNGVVVLLNHMKSNDQTVKWFKGKGHLLLETPHILPETMATISDWLLEHSQKANIVRANVVHGRMSPDAD